VIVKLGHETLPADPGGTRSFQKSRGGKVVADHEGCHHQGRMVRPRVARIPPACGRRTRIARLQCLGCCDAEAVAAPGQSLRIMGARDESALSLIAAELLAAGIDRAERDKLCPSSSDIDLFRDGKGVINLNAEVAHGALDLGVAEQQLDGSQIAGSAIDQSGLGPAQ
jgi:hypothetical protein